ncbi:MAG: GDP-mannose 4,6-dehydratase, partial [Limisphaerales bacterium]
RILQSPEPKDYVIATGVGVTLECFVAEVFNSLGLLWRDHVVVDSNLYRPTDIQRSVGDAGRAKEELNWSPRITMPLLAKVLVEQSLMLE